MCCTCLKQSKISVLTIPLWKKNWCKRFPKRHNAHASQSTAAEPDEVGSPVGDSNDESIEQIDGRNENNAVQKAVSETLPNRKRQIIYTYKAAPTPTARALNLLSYQHSPYVPDLTGVALKRTIMLTPL